MLAPASQLCLLPIVRAATRFVFAVEEGSNSHGYFALTVALAHHLAKLARFFRRSMQLSLQVPTSGMPHVGIAKNARAQQ